MHIFLHLQAWMTIFELLINTLLSMLRDKILLIFFTSYIIQGLEVSILYHLALGGWAGNQLWTCRIFFLKNGVFSVWDMYGIVGKDYWSDLRRRWVLIWFSHLFLWGLDELFCLLNRFVDNNVELTGVQIKFPWFSLSYRIFPSCWYYFDFKWIAILCSMALWTFDFFR